MVGAGAWAMAGAGWGAARSAAGHGMSAARGAYSAGAGRIGRPGMNTAIGAGAGAIYGGTAGRDRGQSRLGGALTGAMGGAALGRYGGAAIGQRGSLTRHHLSNAFAPNASGRGQILGSAMRSMGRGMRAQGQKDYRWASAQGARAMNSLGPHLQGNKAVQSLNSTLNKHIQGPGGAGNFTMGSRGFGGFR